MFGNLINTFLELLGYDNRNVAAQRSVYAVKLPKASKVPNDLYLIAATQFNTTDQDSELLLTLAGDFE